jgi:Dynamin family
LEEPIIRQGAGPDNRGGTISRYVRKLLASYGVRDAPGATPAPQADGTGDTGSDDTWRRQRQPNQSIRETEPPMAGSQRQVPCLALLGEFSAGKSSVVNLLLGRDMLPTAVLSNTRRPTRVRYAPELKIEAISEAGEREPVSSDALKALVREDIGYLDIGTPNEFLRNVELLDTPGFADPFRSSERTLDAVKKADICIWCTLATQAWRQSERQIWLSLPARLRTNGILVVTHADTLAHRGEQRRVRTRLKREVNNLFADIVLLAVPDAMRALGADGQIADQDLWRISGGSVLMAAVQRAVIDCREGRGKNSLKKETNGLLAATRLAPTITSAAANQMSTPETVKAAEPAPEGSRELEPGAGAELQRFLATVMETVPACVASAWVDLTKRKVLQLYGLNGGEIIGTETLGEAITALLQGSNVQRIERLFKRSHDLAEEGGPYFKEIVILTDDCVGVFLRDQSRADHCLAVVSDRTANLGMVLARARSLLESAELLI